MDDKLHRLRDILQDMGSVAVAYAGGTDSTFVLKVAYDVLGDRAIALTADSPSLSREELRSAEQIAAGIGAKHVLIPVDEMEDPRYLANNPDRCYFCKSHTYEDLIPYAQAHGFQHVVDGNNADDVNDHRPGRQAAQERGVRSPLQEAGMHKSEIRQYARELGLPNWNKPAAACLSSRIPYGTAVTVGALSQIENAENYLRSLGFGQLRVRHHGDVARIELEGEDLPRALDLRDDIARQLRSLGFLYVTLDLSGFRTGSMNEVLKRT
jgi:pyridinium-3,5-biscarboxylic acid mononucleotide sulfurtransferase